MAHTSIVIPIQLPEMLKYHSMTKDVLFFKKIPRLSGVLQGEGAFSCEGFPSGTQSGKREGVAHRSGSSPCGERPSLTRLLFDLLISGGFGGSENLNSPPQEPLLFAHRGSSFIRIIVASSLSLAPHTLYHEF
ncbi:Mitogen-Activated Protein Kinase Kinase Kinase 12 [Manis pentadactyla]|nr:Mitogen-Activated Protein Kinase Kinase Kinase 12 [Manis pentadactyla]